MEMYDLCIVGAGMVGSAAARHACLMENQKQRVCLIGPSEPKIRDITESRDIFGAHYDEARITRELACNVAWSTLARNSIDRYKKLEKTTGIPFYREVGMLVNGAEHSECITSYREVILANNIQQSRELTDKERKSRFPYLNFPASDACLFEEKRAGYINPRLMVQAEQTAAHLNGCDIVDDIVNSIEETTHQMTGESCLRIETDDGKVIHARKVLLATGGFTALRRLLPAGVTLDIRLRPTAVGLVEITKEDAMRLRDMPSLYYQGPGNVDWSPPCGYNSHEEGYSFYMLPPVKYPDGRYYLKIGGEQENTAFTGTSQEMKQWYCSDLSSHLVKAFADLVTSIVKGITVLSTKGDTCVITVTPTKLPYIDMVSSRIGIALGGNGYAAKSCDEIGRIAAALVLRNRWESELPRESFKLKTKGLSHL